MRKGEEWLVFSDLRHSGYEDALREIANLIREGCTDPRFVEILANHIDPDKVTPFGTKFVVKHAKRGALRREVNYDLGHFLWRHIDVWGEPAESVVANAKVKFGAGRSKCFEALEHHRATLRRVPGLEQSAHEVEKALRELGHPSAAPFSPGKS